MRRFHRLFLRWHGAERLTVVEQANMEAGKFSAMGRSPGMRVFRTLYLGAALVYALLIIFWGRHDMGRVQREYRLVMERLTGGYAQELAAREVEAGCRRAAGGSNVPGYADCLRSAAPVVQKRAAVITAELVASRHLALEKMAIFYLLVTLLLIVAPVSLLYVILVSVIYLLSNIRHEKE